MSRQAFTTTTTAALLLLASINFRETVSNPIRIEYAITEVVQSCSSPIYCQGELLDIVQKAELFSDSKTFVDMSQLNPVNVTLEHFWQLMNATSGNPTKEDLLEFVNSNFLSSNETVDWTPPDFNRNPTILSQITDEKVRQFAQNLINIWPTLGRKISPDVYNNPDQHSILEVPNGFIVPGGRFREIYYFDSYWIVKGLLLTEMYDTARGIIENICYLIELYGFMPNGSRLYYLNRSQPPLLSRMIYDYVNQTNDTEWLKNNVQCVEQELTFFLKNRTETFRKEGVSYELAHYAPSSNTPRPESYDKDLKICGSFDSEAGKRQCYKSLKSAAESGWDFSSRWFFDSNGGIETNLTHTGTDRVVPVDLNAILCQAFSNLAGFYGMLGDNDKQVIWQERSDIWKKSLELVFYDEDEGIWFDYDPILQKTRKYFYPSNFAPLWTQSYDLDRRHDYGKKAASYFLKMEIDLFQGGIPASLDQTGEQWDLRNAWPPLQDIIVSGLLQTGNSNATEIARTFGQRWISANMIGYEENQIMFEKYDAVDPGKFGGGGEYVVQPGFGWTNGVALYFIDLFYTNK